MSLQTLSRDCTVQAILTALAKDGACIVEGVLSPEDLAALDADLNPLIDQTPMGVEEFGTVDYTDPLAPVSGAPFNSGYRTAVISLPREFGATLAFHW